MNYDEDAVVCMEFLIFLRVEMSAQRVSFPGYFSENCEEKFIAAKLPSFFPAKNK